MRALAKIQSDNLKRLFQEKGLSCYEVARRAGLNYSVLHRGMNGETILETATLVSVAEVLGVSINHILKPPASKDAANGNASADKKAEPDNRNRERHHDQSGARRKRPGADRSRRARSPKNRAR